MNTPFYYGDIVAMANSVENRSPFMDHRLVEYAFSCDESLKVKDDSITSKSLEILKNNFSLSN